MAICSMEGLAVFVVEGEVGEVVAHSAVAGVGFDFDLILILRCIPVSLDHYLSSCDLPILLHFVGLSQILSFFCTFLPHLVPLCLFKFLPKLIISSAKIITVHA